MMFKIASLLQTVSEADMQFIKKDKEYLVVGKEDKRIGIVSPNGDFSDISNIVEYKIDGTGSYRNGKITIPTTDKNLIVQWGFTLSEADETNTHTFPNKFPNNAYVMVGNASNVSADVSVKADSKDNFTIVVDGGSGNVRVAWLAIGD